LVTRALEDEPSFGADDSLTKQAASTEVPSAAPHPHPHGGHAHGH
jgi:hypothetical protein